MHQTKNALSQNHQMLQTVHINRSDAIKVENVFQRQPCVTAKISVPTVKMKWAVTSNDPEDARKTHSPVEVENVYQNTSSVMR